MTERYQALIREADSRCTEEIRPEANGLGIVRIAKASDCIFVWYDTYNNKKDLIKFETPGFNGVSSTAVLELLSNIISGNFACIDYTKNTKPLYQILEKH